MLNAADIHVARRLGAPRRESDERVLLAAALTVRAARLGSVCLDLVAAPTQIVPEADEDAAAGQPGEPEVLEPATLAWPDPEEWMAACEASPLVEWGARRSRRAIRCSCAPGCSISTATGSRSSWSPGS